MPFWSNSDDQANAASASDNYAQADNKASISHELLAGAASFEAAKAWENHVAQNGAPPSHAMAKELAAAAIGAFVDREAETRGEDYIDNRKAQKAKETAQAQAEQQLSQQYDNDGNYAGGGNSGY